jgi:hypothetical protein
MTDLRREALKHAMPWLVLAALLIVWELCCIVFQVPEIILPRPTKIFAVFYQRFDILMAYSWDTLWTTMIGFLLAIAFGLLLGLAGELAGTLQRLAVQCRIDAQGVVQPGIQIDTAVGVDRLLRAYLYHQCLPLLIGNRLAPVACGLVLQPRAARTPEAS